MKLIRTMPQMIALKVNSEMIQISGEKTSNTKQNKMYEIILNVI